MINLLQGQLKLGPTRIFATSSYEDLDSLAEENVIEKRGDGEGTYFYVEAVVDDMLFGVFITCREKKIHSMILRWLDGPCTSQGWESVSEEALRDEYRLLSNFVKKNVGASADEKKLGTRTWRLKWGRVDVSYEARDFAVAIFMLPR